MEPILGPCTGPGSSSQELTLSAGDLRQAQGVSRQAQPHSRPGGGARILCASFDAKSPSKSVARPKAHAHRATETVRTSRETWRRGDASVRLSVRWRDLAASGSRTARLRSPAERLESSHTASLAAAADADAAMRGSISPVARHAEPPRSVRRWAFDPEEACALPRSLTVEYAGQETALGRQAACHRSRARALPCTIACTRWQVLVPELQRMQHTRAERWKAECAGFNMGGQMVRPQQYGSQTPQGVPANSLQAMLAQGRVSLAEMQCCNAAEYRCRLHEGV